MVTCIVQARTGSTRLPGKVLKEVLGMPMILATLKRLQKSKYIDQLILATSNKPQDEPLYNTVKSAGFEAFRGDENNVLLRYVQCIEKYGGDTVIRVTGDCPLIDPQIVDHVITKHGMYHYDYIRLDVPNTFIRGFDVEVFSREALMKTYSLAKDEKYTEHVTYYMYSHRDEFSVGIVEGEEIYRRNYRLCVDTPEDFELVTKIYEHFNDLYVGASEVVKLLDGKEELANINREIIQKHV